jgi:CHAD domain-containing protein
VSEFLPPDGQTLEAAGETLITRLNVRDGGTRATDRTFFDTFDGLLHEEGMSVVHDGARLTLVDRESGAVRAALPRALPTEPLLAHELPPGSLRVALLGVIEVRALLPLAHIHSRVRALDVLDGEDKTVVRLALEEPALISSTGRHTALRPRLRVDAVRGYDKPLHRVRRTIELELGFTGADQPLVDEAVRAAGGTPAGIGSKVHVPLAFADRADRAAAAVLRRLLEVIEANLEGTIADVDSEFLHDFRVSVRRTRAVQRELKSVFGPLESKYFRGEFRWLQRVTGDSRDLDVYLLEFESYRKMVPESMRPDLDPLRAVLGDRRAIARAEMVLALLSDRTIKLLSGWSSFLDGLEASPHSDRPDAARPIGLLSGERIHKVYKRMVKMGDAIDGSSSPEAYHELRKKGKELRYLLELFGAPLYPEEVVKPMIKALKSLQDVLGRHQDREVQVAMLRSLRDQVAAVPAGSAALMAMGVLVERLVEDEQAARDEFAERFAGFASRAQRKLVKDVFA